MHGLMHFNFNHFKVKAFDVCATNLIWRGQVLLLFFLKGLENDDARLPELIRDRIEANEMK